MDPYKTVFGRPTEHWCIHLFLHTQTHKTSSIWETPLLKIVAHGVKDRYYGDIPSIL
jgi:hypothetical protein